MKLRSAQSFQGSVVNNNSDQDFIGTKNQQTFRPFMKRPQKLKIQQSKNQATLDRNKSNKFNPLSPQTPLSPKLTQSQLDISGQIQSARSSSSVVLYDLATKNNKKKDDKKNNSQRIQQQINNQQFNNAQQLNNIINPQANQYFSQKLLPQQIQMSQIQQNYYPPYPQHYLTNESQIINSFAYPINQYNVNSPHNQQPNFWKINTVQSVIRASGVEMFHHYNRYPYQQQ